MTRNSRNKKRNREIQSALGLRYSAARRLRQSDQGGESRPDFTALFAEQEDFSPRAAAALWCAVDLVCDDEEASWLPPVARGDRALLSRMLEIVRAFRATIGHGEVPSTDNMAEQIALSAVISEAQIVDYAAKEDVEYWSWYLKLDPGDLEVKDMTDILLFDIDHEFLFDPEFDGIENNEGFAALTGAVNLHPSRWFEPFYYEATSL